MMEKIPPAIQTATSQVSLSTAPATIEGVPNIPAPMISPTIIAMASKSESVCFGVPSSGAALTLVAPCFIGGAAQRRARDDLRGPVRLARRRAVADAHGARHRIGGYAAGELVALVARATLGLGRKRDLVAVVDAAAQ